MFSWSLHAIWFVYIVLAVYNIRPTLSRLFSKRENINGLDFWLVNLIVGVTFIFIGYTVANYTSYIVGALSFSFTFYLSIVIWVFKKRKKNPLRYDRIVKYGNKRIVSQEAELLSSSLDILFTEKQPYLNPNLKLQDVASALEVSSHSLSQYLNDNLGKSFSKFINEYRVKAAEDMIRSNALLTLEAIGNECGFKSNSTFYGSFKEFNGRTPAQFKKGLKED